MVELNKKYQIGVKRFGLINWIGFKSLWLKECNRFIVVWQQTLLSPLVSSLLFLSVLSLALGNNREDVLGYSFVSFLAPGLIAMSILTQSFSHSVSSLMISKIFSPDCAKPGKSFLIVFERPFHISDGCKSEYLA